MVEVGVEVGVGVVVGVVVEVGVVVGVVVEVGVGVEVEVGVGVEVEVGVVVVVILNTVTGNVESMEWPICRHFVLKNRNCPWCIEKELIRRNEELKEDIKKKTRPLERYRAEGLEALLNGSEQESAQETSSPGRPPHQVEGESEAKEFVQSVIDVRRRLDVYSRRGEALPPYIDREVNGLVLAIRSNQRLPRTVDSAKQSVGQRKPIPRRTAP